MANRSMLGLLALLLAAAGASAATLGPINGKPLAGRPLRVSVPFSVDQPKDRACASASLRYGDVPVRRVTLHVQGHGMKRSLLVTSPVKVNEQPVTVDVRVGCGPKAATRRFVMQAGMPAAKAAPPAAAATRQLAGSPAPKPARQPVRWAPPAEPLFPPPEAQAPARENDAGNADAATMEELRKARAEAATASAQLEATRKELAAVLDVERRTSQILIDADHQVRDAEAEVAHMRLVLQWAGASLVLAAAGLAWWEFSRVISRRRTPAARAPEEPALIPGVGVPV